MDKLGEGTYGIVYKVKDNKLGKIVALKKIRLENEDEGMPSTAMREIAILKELNHPNIVSLEDVYYSPSEKKLHLIFEYVDYDLKKYIKSLKEPLKNDLIKKYMKQFIEGVVHCHNKRIIHRDLKPQNLLINPMA